MATEGERLATVEAVLRELRGDVGELRGETGNSRKRLHNVEGTLGMLVNQEQERRRLTGDRQRSMEVRLQVLTVVIAVTALAEPFLYHLANGG